MKPKDESQWGGLIPHQSASMIIQICSMIIASNSMKIAVKNINLHGYAEA